MATSGFLRYISAPVCVFFFILMNVMMHKRVSLSPSAGHSRRCPPGGQHLCWQRTRGGVPERPVGGGVRLSLVGPGCQCDLQAAGSEVGGAHRATEPAGGTRLTAHSHPPVCVCRSEIGTAVRRAQFGSGSGIFHYERLGCRGDEGSLRECRSRTFVTGDCSHGNEAAVLCAPPEGQRDFSTAWTGAHRLLQSRGR